MVIHAEPEYTLSCALAVSHHKSPVTDILLLGAVLCEIELEIAFHIAKLLFHNLSVLTPVSYQSCPVIGALGAVPLAKFSNNLT
jgi:hypothetical protein